MGSKAGKTPGPPGARDGAGERGVMLDGVGLRARRVITPLEVLEDAVVLIRKGTIGAVARHRHCSLPEDTKVIDVGDKTIVPGFVDIHIHGAMGEYAGDGQNALETISEYLASTGTTAWVPTVNSLEACERTVASMEGNVAGADVAGIQMEGPFLAPKRITGHSEVDNELRSPSVDEFAELADACQGTLKAMGIAPELDGALEVIREMRRAGVVPAVAHTRATYDQFLMAVEAGARHVTHTYNVMTGMHHRRPGVVGGALTCDQVTAELIADGYHVSPVAMDVLIRCKGADEVAVITDSTPLAGLPDGVYNVFGREVVKQGGVSRLKGTTSATDHTMAGSEWPMNHNVFNLAQLPGVCLSDAIRMATLTPASIIGIDDKKGSIEPGKDADLVVVDDALNVHQTVVGGKIAFRAE